MNGNPPTSDEAVPDGSSHVRLGYYVLSYVDILGQGRELDKLEPLPDGEDGRQKALKILVETAGFITQLRRIMKDVYTKQDAESSEIRIEGFSDTLVFYAKIDVANGVNAVANIFAATASLVLAAMNAGHVLRGAIEIGIGTNLIPNEIYGPVLRRAYLLESKCAQFPRIVIGETAEKFLRDCAASSSPVARLCLDMIVTDRDSVRILDYLGGAAVNLGRQPHKDLAADAEKFVKREFSKWKSSCDAKTASKYSYLVEYFESRRRFWAQKS